MTKNEIGLDVAQASAQVEQVWEASIVPQLIEYIKIPNKSPAFDPDWATNPYMDQAVDLMTTWAKSQEINGLNLEVVRLEGRTPLIFIEIEGQKDGTLLMYGHLDKQPEMEGWDDDLGPWLPVRKGEKLYGRGGADDGYAIYSSLTAIKVLQTQGIAHPRCVVMIEACEESGSDDLPHYVDHLQDRIGEPALVVCLDSGAGNYEQLWNTTSLRGIMGGVLSVEILKEGLHSGYASGVVASSFRILRELLSRVENAETGEIVLEELKAEIPRQRVEQAELAAQMLGDEFYSAFPVVEGASTLPMPVNNLMLNRTWRATLSITGIDNIPSISDGGNVLRPKTSAKLSFRLPPTTDPEVAGAAVKAAFETNPPYGAKVSFDYNEKAAGWNAPAVSPHLETVVDTASQLFYGKPAVSFGEGGSIPFMGMLGEKFPQAQFLITGVLGPNSNAHGPNEFIHIEFAKKLTSCVAYVVGAF